MTLSFLAAHLYNEKWPLQKKPSKISKILKVIFEIYAKLFFEFNRYPELKNRGNVLDIGCGRCTELIKYKEYGWKCFGLDLDSDVKEIGEKHELNIFIGELEEANFPDNYFDLIIMKHSLEHIHNSNDILKEIHRILRVDGILYIEVPNGESLEAKIFKKYWHQFHFGHLYLFSPETLNKLLSKNGLHANKTVHNPQPISFVQSFNFYTNKRFNHPITTIFGSLIVFPITSFAALIKRGNVIGTYSKKVK
jgi:SAM-dependent methyltransferase